MRSGGKLTSAIFLSSSVLFIPANVLPCSRKNIPRFALQLLERACFLSPFPSLLLSRTDNRTSRELFRIIPDDSRDWIERGGREGLVKRVSSDQIAEI